MTTSYSLRGIRQSACFAIVLALALASAASGDSGLNDALSSSFACQQPGSSVTFRTENRKATFRLKNGGRKHMVFAMRDIDPCFVDVSQQAGGSTFAVTLFTRDNGNHIVFYTSTTTFSRQSEGVVACFDSQARAKRFEMAFKEYAGC